MPNGNSPTPSRAISVGDLVQVVRGHPCKCSAPDRTIGLVFLVKGIVGGESSCGACGADLGRTDIAVRSVEGKRSYGVAMHRLKRIPPLSELEGVKTEEDVREPA